MEEKFTEGKTRKKWARKGPGDVKVLRTRQLVEAAALVGEEEKKKRMKNCRGCGRTLQGEGSSNVSRIYTRNGGGKGNRHQSLRSLRLLTGRHYLCKGSSYCLKRVLTLVQVVKTVIWSTGGKDEKKGGIEDQLISRL